MKTVCLQFLSVLEVGDIP